MKVYVYQVGVGLLWTSNEFSELTAITIDEQGQNMTFEFDQIESEVCNIPDEYSQNVYLAYMNNLNKQEYVDGYYQVSFNQNVYFYIMGDIGGSDYFTMECFKNNSEHNALSKDLTRIRSLKGYLRNIQGDSILNFTVDVEIPIVAFNYVYLGFLQRYYYVTDVQLLNTGMYRLTLQVDVLSTYQKEIRKQTGIVARNQTDYNDYLIDEKIQIETSNPIIEITEIEQDLFDATSEEVILQRAVLNVSGKEFM